MNATGLVREALKALVNKIEEIHADPAYRSVWVVNQNHAGPYTGPNYIRELHIAKAVLSATSTAAPAEPDAAGGG